MTDNKYHEYHSLAKTEAGGLTFELFTNGVEKLCKVWSQEGGLVFVLNDADLQKLNNQIMFPWRYGVTMNGDI